MKLLSEEILMEMEKEELVKYIIVLRKLIIELSLELPENKGEV